MQGNQQQAYDRGITIFSPDGRLYQVEYAREAVKRGSPSVGVRTDAGVVLTALTRPRSPLIERDSIEKLHKIDDHVGMASAGHVADARRLIDVARRRAQVERLRYGESIGVDTLTKDITDHIQENTQVGGARPFGASLLVAGVEGDQPRLFETDPSGVSTEWQATAVGRDGEEIREFLEEHYRPDADLDGGVDLSLRALASVSDELDSEDVAVGTVDAETGSFRELSVEEIGDYLAEIDVEEE